MDPARSFHAPYPLALGLQTACYLPWLKVSVALRYVLSFPWTPEARRERCDRVEKLVGLDDGFDSPDQQDCKSTCILSPRQRRVGHST